MLSVNSRRIAYARSTLVLNADTVWKDDDDTKFKQTNLEEWVRLNRLEKVLKRTTVSDSFSLIIKSHKKTVRCIVPFCPSLELGNYGFGGCGEYAHTDKSDISKNAYKNVFEREIGTGVEPWMLTEVEDTFKLLSNGFCTSPETTEYDSEESSYASSTSSGRLYPFYKATTIPYSVFDCEKQKNNFAGANEHQLSSIEAALDEVERDVISEELTEFRFRILDFSSALSLVRFPQLIFPIINTEIPYDVCEVEVVADFAGKCYHQPVSREELGALPQPVSDDDIERFTLPRFAIKNQEEQLLYNKTSSESVQNLWKYYSFKILDCRVRKVNIISHKAEVTVWSSCLCNRCMPPLKRPKSNVGVAGNYAQASSPKNQKSPLKTQGLNAEVPEFFPRKEDVSSCHEAASRIFPSASAGQSHEIFFPYASSLWNGNNFSQTSSFPMALNNPNNYGTAGVNNPPPSYNIQADFYHQMTQHYHVQSHSSQPQFLQPGTPNSFSFHQQMATGTNPPPSYLSNGLQPMSEYGRHSAATAPYQQPWMSNMYGNQCQHQLSNPQLTQLASLYYTSQQLPYLQSQTNELINHSAQKWPCDTAYQKKLMQTSAEGIQCHSQNQRAEAGSYQCHSEPKNIPVFLRPPESYAISNVDSNGRRRKCGGGGVVLDNLIVLTKGGGRRKGIKPKVYDPGSCDKENEGNLTKEDEEKCEASFSDSNGKLEESIGFSPIQDLSLEATGISDDSSKKKSFDDPTPIISSVTALHTLLDSCVSVGTINEAFCKESDMSDGTFLRSGVAGIFPQMTSTPKKGKSGKEKEDGFKWLEVTSSSEDVVSCKNLREDLDTISSKILDLAMSPDGEFSEASFPPIQSYRSHLKGHVQSYTSSMLSSSSSTCHRRLYRDVLAPKSALDPWHSNAARVSGSSPSADSLDKHFVELEKLAMEQYQSSDENVNRIYQELEMEAIEQYPSSSESEGRIMADRSSTSLKDQRSEFAVGKEILSVSRSLCDLEMCSSPSVAIQGQAHPTKQKPPPEHGRPTEVVRVNVEKCNSSITNVAPGEEDGTKSLVDCEDDSVSKEKKPLAEKEESASRDEVEGRGNKHRGDINTPDKGIHATSIPSETCDSNKQSAKECTNEFSQNPSSDERRLNLADNRASVQQETPNEQRTQVSFAAGIKSGDKKEDLAVNAEVPEAWVPNYHQKEIVGQNIRMSEEASNQSEATHSWFQKWAMSFGLNKKNKRRKNDKNNEDEARDGCQNVGNLLTEDVNHATRKRERGLEPSAKGIKCNLCQDSDRDSFGCQIIPNPIENIPSKFQQTSISGSSVCSGMIRSDLTSKSKSNKKSSVKGKYFKSRCTGEFVEANEVYTETETVCNKSKIPLCEPQKQKSAGVKWLFNQKTKPSKNVSYIQADNTLKNVSRIVDPPSKEKSIKYLGTKEDGLNQRRFYNVNTESKVGATGKTEESQDVNVKYTSNTSNVLIETPKPSLGYVPPERVLRRPGGTVADRFLSMDIK